MHTNDLRKLARETNDGVLRGPALGAADEIDRLRAEIEQLTKERDAALKEQDRLAKAWKEKHDYQVKQWKDHADYFDKSQRRMHELKAERDEARDEHRFTLGLLDKAMAVAERDMRQRAADYLQSAADDWRSDGHEHNAKKIEDEIPGVLALPLKHADRENDAALAQGQKEGE